MKKLIIIAILLTIVGSCTKKVLEKTEIVPLSGDPTSIKILDPVGVFAGRGSWVDYCSECGSSTDKADRCLDYENKDHDIICTPIMGYINNSENNGWNPIKTINDFISISDVSSDDQDFSRRFRDSFLIGFPKGVAYMNYFYTLGKFMKDSGIVFNQLAAHLSFANATIASAKKWIGSDSTAIPVTIPYKNDAIDMINYYRTRNTTNLNFQNMLDSMESDVNFFVNKTRTQIKNVPMDMYSPY